MGVLCAFVNLDGAQRQREAVRPYHSPRQRGSQRWNRDAMRPQRSSKTLLAPRLPLTQGSCTLLVRHEFAPEVSLRVEQVVGLAPERDVFQRRRPSVRIRLSMMELEPAGFGAALATTIDIRATPVVPREDRASNRRRNGSTAPARVRRFSRGLLCQCCRGGRAQRIGLVSARAGTRRGVRAGGHRAPPWRVPGKGS